MSLAEGCENVDCPYGDNKMAVWSPPKVCLALFLLPELSWLMFRAASVGPSVTRDAEVSSEIISLFSNFGLPDSTIRKKICNLNARNN